MAVPAGVDQHGSSGDIEGRQLGDVHRASGRAGHPHDDAFQVDQTLQGHTREVRAVGVTVERWNGLSRYVPVLATMEMRPMWNVTPP